MGSKMQDLPSQKSSDSGSSSDDEEEQEEEEEEEEEEDARGLAPSSSSTPVSVPTLTSLDGEVIQLSDEGARLFDAAADGALGGAPERAALFSFGQLVLVEVDVAAAGAASAAPPAAGAARPSEDPAPVSRSLLEKVEVDVDRIPNASSSAATRLREEEGGVEARDAKTDEPLAFLTLGGRRWARVSELLGLAPGAAVRFERDPQTGFLRASRAAGWV